MPYKKRKKSKMLWFYILAIIIGYLIGSISPAYVLGRITKGIDIRKHGSRNAGAMNAFHVLGTTAGIMTLVFDLVKGVLAMFIAYFLITGAKFYFAAFTALSGTSFIIICLVGFAAILGHDFPFYLKFKGGRGVATAGGIMILFIILFFSPYFPTGYSLIQIPGAIPMIILASFALCTVLITGSGNLTSLIFYPLAVIVALILIPNQFSIAFSLFTAYVLFITIISSFEKVKFDLRFAKHFQRRKKEIKLWRKILRFLSLVFPILYFWLDKKYILILIGIFFVIFLVLDFVRAKKRIPGLYKKDESKISGFTLFLLGALIATALFQRELVILALIFAAVGDSAAVLLGIPFGRTKLFRKKSFQGTVACLAFSFAAGLIVMPFLGVHLLIVLFGAVAATLAELFSGQYDNITMAPFAALIMFVIHYAGLAF